MISLGVLGRPQFMTVWVYQTFNAVSDFIEDIKNIYYGEKLTKLMIIRRYEKLYFRTDSRLGIYIIPLKLE